MTDRVPATAASYDERTGDAVVVLDDGTRVPCPGSVLGAAGILRLRAGQRLRVSVADARVTSVALPALDG